MRPVDIAGLVSVGAPALSPDGRWAVAAAVRADLAADAYRSRLWIVATDGSAPARPLTHGERDTAPAFSPDGSWLAFLRAPGEHPAQLHLLPTAGGDARALTTPVELPGGAGAPEWSPDSAHIAFCARVPATGRGPDDPGDKQAPRRITGLKYRLDGVGFVADRRRHVFVVDLAGSLDQLTDGTSDDEDVTWTPDGEHLIFAAARHAGRDRDRSTDLFRIPAGGGTPEQLTDSTLQLAHPCCTPDGAVLAIGSDLNRRNGRWFGQNSALWRAEPGPAPVRPVRLTDADELHVATERIVLRGDEALVTVEHRGAVDLLAVPLNGAPPRRQAVGRRQLGELAAAGGVLVAGCASPTSPGEIVRIDASVTALTTFAAGLADDLVPVEELEATAPDGYPVHGLLALPPGPGPHPVLLLIHGGPFAQYGWTLLDEAQVYATAGYAVVYGNPRGSSGYGQAHADHIVGDVGARQAPDLLALLDAALARPDLDGTRVGVLGGSHGGFMTTWLVGHTNRFRAAVSERSVNAIDSFAGSSDIGWDFAAALYGPDPAGWAHQSPLTHADAIGTPVLIIHSEQDWRCPLEQAQRLFVALQRRDAPVEMLLFPGEGHELSRSGLPSHRVARFTAILEWFARYIPTD